MGAVKGIGNAAVETIVNSRKDGKYKSIFDLAKRIDLRSANKKAFESLAFAGGFDSFAGVSRAQYFHIEGEGITFYEKAMRYGAKYQENENSAQVSLFGEASDVQIAEPVVPPCEDWNTMEKLAKEKEVVGIYISGHPLDDFKFEMENFCNSKLETLKNLELHVNKNLNFGGIITNVQHRIAKNNKGWALFTLEGYDESYEFKIFGEEYLKFRHFLIQNNFTFIKVLVKEGWTDKETGKKSDPRLQFMVLQYLQDVLPSFAKKLIINLNIKDLKPELIHELNAIFQQNKGENTVVFEVLETETIKKTVELVVESDQIEDNSVDGNEDLNLLNEAVIISNEVEEIKTITKIEMPSRKLKIKISNQLLTELERLKIDFSLN
jgi:DNA polymerase-3 subunit alpha